MTGLPTGWKALTLQDALLTQPNGRLLQQGWSPRCLTGPARNHDTWGVLKTTAIQPGWFDDRQNKELPPELEPRTAIEVAPGDLLMTCAGPRSRCGVPALVRTTRPRLMMSGKMYRFRPKPGLRSDFLEKWLLTGSAQSLIDQMKTGISDSGLNLTQDRFLALPVPQPPLTEQRRIVEIVEDHLSRLDVATTALASASLRLCAAEQAWLRDNLVPNQSQTAPLSASLTEVRGGWSRSAKHLVRAEDGHPYLKMNNVTRRGDLDLSSLVHVAADASAIAKYGVSPGDVIFNSKNSGDLIGKTALADTTVSGAILNENLMRLRFGSTVQPEFAVLWFLGPVMRAAITGAASASTNVAAVYQNQLLRMPMWTPPREQQNDLVRQFAALRGHCRRLDQQTEILRHRSAQLRGALLAAAFSGRLTGRSTDTEVIEELAHV